MCRLQRNISSTGSQIERCSIDVDSHRVRHSLSGIISGVIATHLTEEFRAGARMVAKPFIIETRSFSKKGDATLFFRAILNRYKPGDRVSDADALDLRALLKCHTEYATKIGVGIDHFCVMANLHNTQSFEIVRFDGTRDDFSYVHCIRHYPTRCGNFPSDSIMRLPPSPPSKVLRPRLGSRRLGPQLSAEQCRLSLRSSRH